MRHPYLKLVAVVALVIMGSWTPAAGPTSVSTGVGASFESIGPLSFGPDGTLFAADTQGATIFALDLGTQAAGAAKSIPEIDQKIAALLGIDVSQLIVTDMAVHPKSRNAFISVMRGQGTGATPVLLRVDGAGQIEVVALDTVKYSKVTLPNPAVANQEARRNPRQQVITDMAYVDGRLYVAGLSNEEFASKLRAVPYPFTTVDNGASVEIYHGSHGAFETRSPVFSFVPYKIDSTPHLIAGYLCTPLVKFPLDSLKAGAKVQGTTIAELGNGNRPIDMIVYRKDGKDYLLMSNTSRGVMKIPTDRFGTEPGIITRISGTAGVPFETVAHLKGVEQMDLLDDRQSLVLVRVAGTLNLEAIQLP